MFRLDEFATDLHTPYRPDDAPSRRLWLSGRALSRPFRVAGPSPIAAPDIEPIACTGRVIVSAAAGVRAEPMGDKRIGGKDPHEAILARGGLHARFRMRRPGSFMQTAEAT